MTSWLAAFWHVDGVRIAFTVDPAGWRVWQSQQRQRRTKAVPESVLTMVCFFAAGQSGAYAF